MSTLQQLCRCVVDEKVPASLRYCKYAVLHIDRVQFKQQAKFQLETVVWNLNSMFANSLSQITWVDSTFHMFLTKQ